MGKIFQRFVDIWKMDFLANLVVKERGNAKLTVYFWIVSSVFVAFLLTCSFCFSAIEFKTHLVDLIEKNVSEDAKIAISMGQLSTEGIDVPFFREIAVENEHNGEYIENYVFIIDTHSQGYDITSLDEYSGGVVVLQDRMYVKDDRGINHMLFSEVSDFSVDRSQIFSFIEKNYIGIVVLVSFVIFVAALLNYVVFRLLFLPWWAFMLWIFSRILEYPLSYGFSCKAILNFNFIPTIIIFVLVTLGLQVQFWDRIILATTIFIVVFLMNLLWMKRNKIEDEIMEVDKNENVKKVPQASVKTVDNGDRSDNA